MKNKIRVLFIYLFLALVIFAFSACKEEEGNDEELVYWCNSGYLSDFEERMAEFTKETGIKVRVEGIQANSWGELAQQIAASSYSGDLPDCGDIATEAMATLIAADLLEPIDDLYERDINELQESIVEIDEVLLNAHVYNGVRYSLPTTWNNMCMYYNKNVLASAGIEPNNPNYPHDGWTIDNFLYCCKEITKNNVLNGASNKYGYKIQNQYFLTIEPWLKAYNTSILNNDWTESTINSSSAKQCFAMLNNMMNNSDVKLQLSPKFGGTAEFDLFYSNRLGFVANGLPYVYNLYTGNFNNGNLKEGYDVVLFPSIDGESRTTIGVGGCPIFKTSKNKENAWKLAKFLSSKTFQEDFLTKNIWAIPVIKSAADKLLEKDFFPNNGKIFYDSLKKATIIPAPTAYSAIELEVRKWFGGYLSNTAGFDLEGEGMNSLDNLSNKINNFLGK